MVFAQIKNTVGRTSVVQAGIVSFATLLGASFSYFLQFFLAQKLTVEQYGEFNALLSLSIILFIPATFFGLPLIKAVSGLNAQNEKQRINGAFSISVILSLIVGMVIGALTLALGNKIIGFLKLEETTSINYFALYMVLGFASQVPISVFQGFLEYKKYAVMTVFSSLARMAIPMILVLLGFKVGGVYLGFFIGTIISLLFSVPFLRKLVKIRLRVFNKDNKEFLLKLLRVGVFAVVLNSCLMIITNQDVLLVKRYFDSTSAGYYSGVVTVGKVLLYGASAVSIVMFPKISALHARNENPVRSFEKLLLLQFLAVLAGVVCYTLFSKIIVDTLFGPKFSSAVSYLPLFSMYVGIYVLINFLSMYFIAIGKNKTVFLLIPIIILQNLLINFYHQDLYQVIYSNMFSCGAGFTLLVFYLLKSEKQQSILDNSSPSK